MSVPEESVIGAFPQWELGVGVDLALEGVREVEGVGKVHGSIFEVGGEEVEVGVLVWVVEGLLAQREEFGGLDFVDRVAFDSADLGGFGDDDDVFVWGSLACACLPTDVGSHQVVGAQCRVCQRCWSLALRQMRVSR